MKAIVTEAQLNLIKEFLEPVSIDRFVLQLKKYLSSESDIEYWVKIEPGQTPNKPTFSVRAIIRPINAKILTELNDIAIRSSWFCSAIDLVKFGTFNDVVPAIKALEQNQTNAEVLFDRAHDVVVTDKKPYYYHLTDRNHLAAIMKKGLLPKKSKSKEFGYSERVYLGEDNFTMTQLQDFFINKKQFKWNPNDSVVLKVVVPDNIPLYVDTKFYGGVYTTNPIPPQNISVIKLLSYREVWDYFCHTYWEPKYLPVLQTKGLDIKFLVKSYLDCYRHIIANFNEAVSTAFKNYDEFSFDASSYTNPTRRDINIGWKAFVYIIKNRLKPFYGDKYRNYMAVEVAGEVIIDKLADKQVTPI